jgi:hypothetical protein
MDTDPAPGLEDLDDTVLDEALLDDEVEPWDEADLEPHGAPILVLFFDLAGLPGWGSEAQPNDPDTSSILDHYLGPLAADIRLVRGCTAIAIVHDAHAALAATMDLLGESARSSGSATAGAHVTRDAIDEVGPGSHVARAAAELASLAEADRLLVSAEVLELLGPADGAVLSFDPGTPADVDGQRLHTFVVRRR